MLQLLPNVTRIIPHFIVSVLFAVIFCSAETYCQAATKEAKVPWRLIVVVMDGTDLTEKARIPVEEAVKFVEANSRFVFEVGYVITSERHGYTPYRVGPDKNRDGKGDEIAYAMMGWNLRKRLVWTLPVASSYLFLYKLNGKRPVQAGSSLGLDFGLMIGGKPRPYATVPTDMTWFVNTPNLGFKSWAAQILAHEIINTIQAKVEARPYRCGQLKGDIGLSGDKYEALRLENMTDKCYARLGRNAN